MTKPSERMSKLRSFAKSAERRHGQGMITFSRKVLPMPRLSTGSLTLDATLGGGIPVGRITMLWGKKSAGKSLTTYMTIADAQKRCANCLRHVEIEDVIEHFDEETGEFFYEAKAHCDCYEKGLFKPKPYPDEREPKAKDGLKWVERTVPDPKKEGKTKKVKVALFEERLERYKENSYEEFRIGILDVENTYDAEWGAKIGVDNRRLMIEVPAEAEEAIDTYDALIRTGAVDLLIVDSIAQMTPNAEIEASTEDWQQGLQARLINKMCRKTVSAMVKTARDTGRVTTQIWVNQPRQKIGGSMFGPTEVLPGGKGQEFAPSVEVKMWTSKWEAEEVDEGMKKDDTREMGTFVRINFKTEKNKTAPAKAIGSFVLNVRTGQVEEMDQILSLCEKYGILKKSATGNKWMFDGGEFKSKTAAVEKMSEPATMRRLKSELLVRMLGQEAA